MPLQATSGAASYDAFGGGVPVVPNYIEEVFSTYLYTGTGVALNINNGIDLSTKGGLVWIKQRSGTGANGLIDTARGRASILYSNTTGAATTDSSSTEDLTSFNSNGFSLGSQFNFVCNSSGQTFTSWTFRKQPKFFDVVTFSGTGSVQNISHNLGSVPACMIIKDTTNAGSAWAIYHTSLGNTQFLQFTTSAAGTSSGYWNNTSPTSTQFTVGTNGNVNQSGATYVAYIFAHNAGGFGLTGTDNVISCGSFTTDSSRQFSVNLGYEPQWVLQKPINQVFPWQIIDTMRGFVVSEFDQVLAPNTSGAEGSSNNLIQPTATGFKSTGTGDSLYADETYIYIAIRRGPMKVPTSGTSVFAVSTASGEPAYSPLFTAGFSDMTLHSPRVSESGNGHLITDRLRGNGVILETPYTNAENTISTYFKYDSNDGAYIPNIGYFNNTGGTSKPYALRAFRRAPSFFDEVCYTGTGVANTAFTHNLTVTPELMIVKPRSAATAPNWRVWSPINSTDFNLLQLSTDGAASSSLYSSSNVFPAIPTATTFTVGGSGSIQLNQSGQTFVAYLFSTCAGVSKVGSFTGNGSSQTINCGFTGGARFVMIKATSTTGDWMVADSARGIVSGSDPYLELNNTNAEVTGEDWLDTDSTGFVVNEVSGSNANTNGVTYIFLAIA